MVTGKSVILSSECCLSFAGSPELASQSVEEFRFCYPEGANFVETKRYFEEKHSSTNVDFLWAFSRRRKFVRISDGHTQDLHEGWIGDAAAFKRYKEYEKRSRPSPHGSLLVMDITPFSVRKKNA